MNCDLHLTDKLGAYKQEVDRLGIPVVPPCVNRSEPTFSVSEGRIVYALGALKNVGVEAMRLIADARHAAGRFDGLFDFAARVDLRRLGKRALEMLARSGALDALELEPPQGLREPGGADGLLGRRPRRARVVPGQPLRRGRRRPARAAAAAARRLVADGPARPGERGDRLLPLRPPARRLRGGAAPREGRHPRRARAAGRGRPDGGAHRRHHRRRRPAQVGARHPLRLRPPLRPDRPLRGAGVLRRARRGPRPPRARPERGADRRGDRRGRRGPPARPPRPADRRRRRRRRRRRPARLPRRRRRRRALARRPPRRRSAATPAAASAARSSSW